MIKKISIVTPVYNEESVFNALIVISILKKLIQIMKLFLY